MLENILNLVKNYTKDAVATNTNIPDDKKEQATDTIVDSLSSGLKNQLSAGNLSQISQMLLGDSSTDTNPIVNNLKSTVANALSQRAGLNPSIASTVAVSIVPMIMKMFSNKVNDPNDKDFSLENVLGAFTGNKQGGNILGNLGNLFK